MCPGLRYVHQNTPIRVFLPCTSAHLTDCGGSGGTAFKNSVQEEITPFPPAVWTGCNAPFLPAVEDKLLSPPSLTTAYCCCLLLDHHFTLGHTTTQPPAALAAATALFPAAAPGTGGPLPWLHHVPPPLTGCSSLFCCCWFFFFPIASVSLSVALMITRFLILMYTC